MKLICLFLLVLLTVAACSKTNTEVTASGNGSGTITPAVTYTAWQLTGLSIANVPHTLTTQQASFKMTLYFDGRYSDTDGIAGTWSNPTTNTLVINQTNLPRPITLGYKIISQTTSSLSLTMGTDSTQINLIYAAK
jgi:hypothetical protein